MDTDWEALYRTGDTGWDKGEPSPGLVDFLDAHPELERGRVLVPGCGKGHDVRAWADQGFAATGLDVAPSAVRLCRELTSPGNALASFACGDFLADDPVLTFDWMFEHTLYCAIQPRRRGEYVEAAKRWLRPGAFLLAVHYFIPDEQGPPFGTDREEILARFSHHFELIADWVPRSYPNRTNLERMFWWRRR